MAITANTTRGVQYLTGQFPSTPLYRSLPVNTSQTIYIGDLVILSSGLISIFATGSTTTGLVGIAASACTSAAAGTRIDVQLVNPTQLWVMNMITSSGTNYTSAQADIGVQCGVVRDETATLGKWYAAQSDNTNKFVTPIDWAPEAYQKLNAAVVVGTTVNPAVIVRFIASACLY